MRSSATASGTRSIVGGRLLLWLAALTAALVALPALASAAYIERGSFENPFLFNAPRKAAVEQGTGNLFVVNSLADGILVFEPAGEPSGTELRQLTQFGQNALDNPRGIAIRESAGETEVYVSDAGNNRIVRYLSDEAEVPSFTLDPTYVSPPHGTGEDEVQSFASAIALAPNGDLWIADSGVGVVKRFDSSGAHVAGSNFDGFSSGTTFTGLRDIAVNSAGDVYVVDQTGNIEKQLGTSRVVRFSSAGAHQATLTPVGPNQRPANVAVNPADDSVVVSGEADAPRRLQAPTLHFFDSADAPLQELSTGGEDTSVQGLAFRPGGKDLLYVIRDYGEYYGTGKGTPGIGIFEEASPPAATIDPASGVTATAATIAGEVEPNGQPTTWKVEYKPVASFSWSSSPVQSAGNEAGQVQVSRILAGLKPGTEYVARIRASSSDGVATTPEVTFTTLTAAPTVISQYANAESDSAVLRARIDPGGSETTYRFEYGPTDSYGSQTADQTIPAGAESPTVSAQVSDLQPGTSYHFRVVAENANGTVEGPDRTFTTMLTGDPCPNAAYRTGASAVLTDCRAYELVTPPGSEADIRIAGGPSTPDGSVVCFNTEDRLAGSDPNGIKTADDGYCATRGPDGWKTTWVTGPAPKERISSLGSNVYFLSPDGERAVFASDGNLLGRDYWPPPGTTSASVVSAYMWHAGQTTWLAPPPPPVGNPPEILPEGINRPPAEPGGYADRRPAAVSEDLTHGIFESDLPLLPQDQNELPDVYEWYPGGLRIVSRDNWNRAVGGRVMLHNTEQVEAPDGAVSADGSRIFFFHAGPIDGLPAPEGVGSVYMREGDELTLVSPRRGTGPDADVVFAGASADGETAFLETVQQLTPEPKEDGKAIYRYDVSEDELELLADAPGGVELLDSSRNGSTFVYHEKTSKALVVNRNGKDAVLGTVGPLDAIQSMFRVANPRPERRTLRITPDGRVVVFVSTGKFGSSGPGLAQVYRWEAGDGLDNISAPESGPVTANASIGAYAHILPGDPREEFLHAHRGKTLEGRVVSDDGSRVFFETPLPLAERDVNGTTDVYEWHDGKVNLVSTGTGGKTLYHESSADGKTVFLQTFDRLIPELDQNARRDLYVAQPGGGFDLPAPPPSCQGDACQPKVPAPVPAGPRVDAGEANLAPAPKVMLGKKQLARLANKGRTTLRVRVAAPGKVTAVLKAKLSKRKVKVAKASRPAAGPGVVKLRIKLSKKARRELSRRGKLRTILVVRQSGQTVRKVVMLRD